MKKQRLIIDVNTETLKVLAKEGVDKGKSRKAYIETVLEDKSIELTNKNK